MFSELGTAETSPDDTDSESSILDILSGCPEDERLDVVANHVRRTVAAVFDLAVTDIGSDDTLNDIGLDSMMAMDFRTRVNAIFVIDLPVLEILQGVSVNSLAVRILAELELAGANPPAVTEPSSGPPAADDDVDRLIEQLSEAELRELLSELERRPTEQETGGAHF
jgi:acyl carrier protein